MNIHYVFDINSLAIFTFFIMAPFFTFFVPKSETDRVAPYIKKLDRYYPSFVDSINVTGPMIKEKYHKSNSKFFGIDLDELVMFDIETVDILDPLVVLTVDTNRKMKMQEWKCVYNFLQKVFGSLEVDYELEEEMIKIVPKPVVAESQMLIDKTVEVSGSTEYGFRYEVIDGDICVCEIIKPYTDLPYTTIIRNYSERGFLPVFTALYVCQSWGVTNLDHGFMYKLWEYLNMSAKYGELDLEKLLKDDIEKCKQGFPEPEVYRASIEGVSQIWSRKNKRLTDDERTNKFIKL